MNCPNIHQQLLDCGRPQLAKIWRQFSEMSVEEYARQLWTQKKKLSLEPELKVAFFQEWQRIGLHHLEEMFFSLEQTRVLQTATHLTATEGPTFLQIHRLATYQMPKNEWYLVGAFSGIPFSNSAWSGCLNYGDQTKMIDLVSTNCPLFRELQKAEADRRRDGKETRISLLPGNLRDGRVYRTLIPDKVLQLLPYFPENLIQLSPEVSSEMTFSQWASLFSGNQLKKLIPTQKLAIFDLNEIITSYLLQVLPQVNHPIHQLLFKKKYHAKYAHILGEAPVWFTGQMIHKKKYHCIKLIVQENQLQGGNLIIEWNAEMIYLQLKKGILCPGLLLCFLVLTFLNGIRCFGSFNQIEYLKKYQTLLLQVEWENLNRIQTAETHFLTTGRCLDMAGRDVYPLDILLQKKELPVLPKTFKELFTPILPKLLSKY